MSVAVDSTAVSFISTLFATLIGVYIAFGLDRRAKKEDGTKTNLNSLLALRNELELNQDIAIGNYKTLSEQGDSDVDVDHYSVDLYTVDSWNAAVQSNVLSKIDPDLHKSIHRHYSQIMSTNEQIRRLRMEPLHQRLEEDSDDGPIALDVWTIRVSYWDEQEERVMECGLGDLIRNRSNRIKIKSTSLEDRLDDEIDELESSITNKANSNSTNRYKDYRS
ncbi:hypothetical protein [Halohasta litorea]|uniref:Uncharacterized protein n=1 Tax=Halohasta litorea TaxID=869891 RepID=A0ABD6D751_9EURY|nr:hypothetical protein [Halohasta litorea]